MLIVPEEAIHSRRETIYNAISDGLEEIVAPALQMQPGTCTDARGASIPTDSCRRSAKLQNFFWQLTQCSIWPRSRLRNHDKSVDAVSKVLMEFQNWRFHGEQRPRKSRFYDKSKCRCIREDLKKEIENVLDREAGQQVGLCLACVKARKAGGQTCGDDANCGSLTLKEHKASQERR